MTSQSPRSFMFYSHEGLGIGHFRRNVTLSRYLRERWPESSHLVVAGSEGGQGLELPDSFEYIKLPSVARVSTHSFTSRHLPISFEQVHALRRDLLLSIVRHFHPDVLLVDWLPAGLKGELAPAIHKLKLSSPGTRFVLGLRDVLGGADWVRRMWLQDGAYDLLENVYDRIFVYGQRDIYDVNHEADLSPRAADKTRYVGYLRREPGTPPPEQLRLDLGIIGPLVLVTVGGGSDGYVVLQAALEALRQWPAEACFDCLLVAGPLMPAREREDLRAMVPAGSRARLLDSVPDLRSYIAAADLVVSRGGYNSICEILSFDRQAVLVHRGSDHRFIGLEEQLLRAEAFERRGLASMIKPSDLTPRLLLEEINRRLELAWGPGEPVSLEGLPQVAAELQQLFSNSG